MYLKRNQSKLDILEPTNCKLTDYFCINLKSASKCTLTGPCEEITFYPITRSSNMNLDDFLHNFQMTQEYSADNSIQM